MLAQQPAGALEAELLLCHALGVERAWLYANGGEDPGKRRLESYLSLVRRRQNGEPLAYLTGVREFWSLPLHVTGDVLIPRPETELLVKVGLEAVAEASSCRIADLGTGSGAVALAIASERPACKIHASDISPGALKVARGNAERLLPGRVTFHLGSWFEPLSGTFHLIVANPPYVAANDPHLAQGDCRFEPRAALTPGDDGLSAIRQIAGQALSCLEPGGVLAFEHGYDQGEACREFLSGLGYERVETRKDLEGQERVTSGRMGK